MNRKNRLIDMTQRGSQNAYNQATNYAAKNMGNEVPKIRLLQFGSLLVVLFLALQVTPRASAQRDARNQSVVGGATQLTVVSSDPNCAAETLPLATCGFDSIFWDQYNNPATEPPVGIDSQKFESAMAAFDNQAVDDFVIAGGTAHYVTGVRVQGDYSAGGGPASSFNIYFYQNSAENLPGALTASFMELLYVGTPPDFLICLPYPFGVGPGTYWVSVQARQDSNPNGQWFWHNRTIRSNVDAAWQNPGDGYGTGCITWSRKNACMADQVWPDQVFQILGFSEGPPPTPRPYRSPRPRPTAAPRPSP